MTCAEVARPPPATGGGRRLLVRGSGAAAVTGGGGAAVPGRGGAAVTGRTGVARGAAVTRVAGVRRAAGARPQRTGHAPHAAAEPGHAVEVQLVVRGDRRELADLPRAGRDRAGIPGGRARRRLRGGAGIARVSDRRST